MPYRATERTRAKQADTRHRILTAARELVQEGGYAAAQVAAVAERAAVGTGTVYRYFPSKGELFAEVFREASQREVDRMAEAADAPGSARERLQHATRVFARRAIRGRRIAYALIAEPVDEAVDKERILYRQAYARVIEAVVAEAVSTGECAPTDPAITAAFIVGGLAEALVGPLAPDGAALDPDLLIETLVGAAERAVFGEAA